MCKVCGKKLVGKQTQFCSQVCKITQWRRDLKQRAVDYLGGKCMKCGYDRCVAALTFHHRSGRKEFGISNKGIIRPWPVIVRELKKCDLLCMNCHAEVHSSVAKR